MNRFEGRLKRLEAECPALNDAGDFLLMHLAEGYCECSQVDAAKKQAEALGIPLFVLRTMNPRHWKQQYVRNPVPPGVPTLLSQIDYSDDCLDVFYAEAEKLLVALQTPRQAATVSENASADPVEGQFGETYMFWRPNHAEPLQSH